MERGLGRDYISNCRGERLSVIFIGRCWIVERRCNDLGVFEGGVIVDIENREYIRGVPA